MWDVKGAARRRRLQCEGAKRRRTRGMGRIYLQIGSDFVFRKSRNGNEPNEDGSAGLGLALGVQQLDAFAFL